MAALLATVVVALALVVGADARPRPRVYWTVQHAQDAAAADPWTVGQGIDSATCTGVGPTATLPTGEQAWRSFTCDFDDDYGDYLPWQARLRVLALDSYSLQVGTVGYGPGVDATAASGETAMYSPGYAR